MNLAEIFSMGGHGGYVWGAYGMTVVLMAVEVLLVCRCSLATRSRLEVLNTYRLRQG